jgi:transcriptional regulator with XRE-family HTH domain
MSRKLGRGETPLRITELLKEEIKKKSQNAISRDSRVAVALINRYLKGIGEPTTATLEKLAMYFGVSILKLRGDSVFDQMTSPDYYLKLTATIDVFLELALISKLLEKNRSFLLAAVSMAKMITQMPVELKETYDKKYIAEMQKRANDVIEKYSSVDLFERYTPPPSKPKARTRTKKNKEY